MKTILWASLTCLILSTYLSAEQEFILEQPDITPEQSGYRLLLEIAEKLPETNTDKTLRAQVLDFLSEEGWESNKVKELLSKAKPALKLWEQFASESPVFMPDTPTPSDKALAAALDAASLQTLAAVENTLRGNIQKSFDQSLLTLRAAESIAHGHGNVIALITAGDIQQLALNAIHYNALDDRVTPAQLNHLIEQLAKLKNFREPLAYALKLEYNGIRDLMMQEKPKIMEYHHELFNQLTSNSPEQLDLSELSLDVEMTLTAMRDYYVETIDNLARPYNEHTFKKSLPLAERYKQTLQQLSAGNLKHHNLLGELTYKQMFQPTEHLITSIYLRETYFEQIKLMLALRGYQISSGQLPATLNLLNNYTEALSIDPFNGDPMHYSRQRSIIWSVGVDAINNNGDRNTPTPVVQFSIQVYNPFQPTLKLLF